jgi:glutaredoxin
LCARKFFRDDEFFERAKGSCAKKYGLCIEPIMEEDEGALDDMDEVEDAGGRGAGGEFLNDDIWYDTLDEEDPEVSTCVMTNISTPALLECDSGSTAPDGTESVPQLVYDTNHVGSNKTRQEGEVIVGCFVSRELHEKLTVKPTENGPALGSGFYVDIKGRKRRFSHRLLAKITVAVAK